MEIEITGFKIIDKVEVKNWSWVQEFVCRLFSIEPVRTYMYKASFITKRKLFPSEHLMIGSSVFYIHKIEGNEGPRYIEVSTMFPIRKDVIDGMQFVKAHIMSQPEPEGGFINR